jgi:hypothetical protein
MKNLWFQFWKINYNCVLVSILHINGTENPVWSLAIQKHKFWIWFWKSDLVLIHFILTQTRTRGLMQVNLWIIPILITISFLFSKACISVLVTHINQIANLVSIQFSKKRKKFGFNSDTGFWKSETVPVWFLPSRESPSLVLTSCNQNWQFLSETRTEVFEWVPVFFFLAKFC